MLLRASNHQRSSPDPASDGRASSPQPKEKPTELDQWSPDKGREIDKQRAAGVQTDLAAAAGKAAGIEAADVAAAEVGTRLGATKGKARHCYCWGHA